ncbi:MAG: hypothetical protein AAF682_20485 [Planctomycetota bacterium]
MDLRDPHPGPAHPELAPREAAELDLGLRRAIGREGPFELSLDAFRDQVLVIASRRRGEADRGERGVGLLAFAPPFLGDLYLARACARRRRDDRAWRAFAAQHCARLVLVARSHGARPAEDAVAGFLADLWMARGGRSSLLASYAGLAPLERWLALVLRRRLAAERRRLPLPARGWSDDDPSAFGAGQEAEYEESRRVFAAVLTSALATLSPRDRDIVESRALFDERGKDTARRIGVSPSYVSQRYRELTSVLRLRLAGLLSHHGLGPEDYR